MDQKYEGGCHKGQLTLVGQLQSRDFGGWLRRRYVGLGAAEAEPGSRGGGDPPASSCGVGSGSSPTAGFLPPQLLPGCLAAQTTNYQRTVATLRGLLTGLYPGTTEAVEVTTHPEIEEFLYRCVCVEGGECRRWGGG